MGIELDITQYYGRDLLTLSERKRLKLVDQAFHHWRTSGFPFREFNDQEIIDEINRLEHYDEFRLKQTLDKPSTVGLALANSFHPQIWQARIRGKSPIEVFNDDATFRYVLGRAPKMYPNRRCWSACCIRMLVGLQNRSRVSNFRPTVARVITQWLSKEGDRILDFCAGYGGRYLGIATLNRYYYGIDVSPEQIAGLWRMQERLKRYVDGDAFFLQAEAENALRDIDTGSFDLIFTSPPYFRLEKYEQNPLQSSTKYFRYDCWKSLFLETVIRESFRIIKDNGYLVINISNYGIFRLEEDFIEICQKYFSNKIIRLMMYMSTNPSYKKRTNIYKKSEPIFVIRK